jgi:hypothetical protein
VQIKEYMTESDTNYRLMLVPTSDTGASFWRGIKNLKLEVEREGPKSQLAVIPSLRARALNTKPIQVPKDIVNPTLKAVIGITDTIAVAELPIIAKILRPLLYRTYPFPLEKIDPKTPRPSLKLCYSPRAGENPDINSVNWSRIWTSYIWATWQFVLKNRIPAWVSYAPGQIEGRYLNDPQCKGYTDVVETGDSVRGNNGIQGITITQGENVYIVNRAATPEDLLIMTALNSLINNYQENGGIYANA